MDITGCFVYDYDNTVWIVNADGLFGELNKKANLIRSIGW